MREQNMMLEHKLKVQEDMLNSGFQRQAEEMKAEINHLKNMIETAKNDDTSWITRTLETIGSEITSVLFAPAKLISSALRGVGSLFK